MSRVVAVASGILLVALIALALVMVRPASGCRVNFDIAPTEESWACWWDGHQLGVAVCPLDAHPEWKKLTDHFGCA
jgi:hypothetical protein